MENRFPKNVRQIGNVSDVPKIYVEDYVDTFLDRLCDRTEETPGGAFLIGRIERQEEQENVYISGAVQIEALETEGPDIKITDEIWDKAQKDCKEFFEDGEIIGWFVCLPGQPLLLNDNLVKLHEQYFKRSDTILIMKDAVEKDELYFAYKYRELMQMGGHYIYYERNPSMQNYMITTRKTIGGFPSETVEDQAAKDFRNIVKERYVLKEQRQNSRTMYAASIFLVLVVLIIGVTTVNNYDKMRSVQSSLEDIRRSVPTAGTAQREAVETNGTVQAGSQEGIEERDTGPAETAEDEDGDGEGQNSESAGEGADGAASEGNSESSGENNDEPSGDVTAEADGAEVNANADSVVQGMNEEIYIVEKGDTLAKISKKVYGDTGHVDAICKMNGLADGNLIFIGQKLLLP